MTLGVHHAPQGREEPAPLLLRVARRDGILGIGDAKEVEEERQAIDRKKQEERWSTFFLPTNMFARYALDGDTLKVWIPDREKFEKALDEKKITLAHTVWSKDILLITAPTADLQRFLEAHGKDEGLFEEQDLRRVKP